MQSESLLLQAYAAGKTKEWLLTHPEFKLNLLQKIKLRRALAQFKRGYCVAAVTGHKEFFGLDFFVNKRTLIPRPDTETLVETVIAWVGAYCNTPLPGTNNIILIDVGTGSGCIPISILKNTKTAITAYATDISGGTLRVARKNAQRHGVDIQFLRGNLLEPLKIDFSKQIIITANLPYLTQTQFNAEPSIQREPLSALVADSVNGLSLYDELLSQIVPLKKFTVFLEIDPSQETLLPNIIKKYFPSANWRFIPDLSGKTRVCVISL